LNVTVTLLGHSSGKPFSLFALSRDGTKEGRRHHCESNKRVRANWPSASIPEETCSTKGIASQESSAKGYPC